MLSVCTVSERFEETIELVAHNMELHNSSIIDPCSTKPRAFDCRLYSIAFVIRSTDHYTPGVFASLALYPPSIGKVAPNDPPKCFGVFVVVCFSGEYLRQKMLVR